MAESIENIPMCGVLPGNVFMEKGLQNFGYVQVKTLEDSILGREGMSFHAHEFHYSRIETLCEPIFLVKKARGGEPCKSGYKIKNALMSYQHINFCGNEKLLKRISEKIGGKHVSE